MKVLKESSTSEFAREHWVEPKDIKEFWMEFEGNFDLPNLTIQCDEVELKKVVCVNEDSGDSLECTLKVKDDGFYFNIPELDDLKFIISASEINKDSLNFQTISGREAIVGGAEAELSNGETLDWDIQFFVDKHNSERKQENIFIKNPRLYENVSKC